jgi:putative molybdopterin biosynthesis protein
MLVRRDGRPRLAPQDAYAQWIAACAQGGWRGSPAGERMPVGDALGRVTAAEVRARWASPRFTCAAMDGIAISASHDDRGTDGSPGGRWLLPATSFTWIDTGDPMPTGTDTVVERERVEIRADGSALITGPATRGRNVRVRGEDFPAGAKLISAGHRLRPGDLAVAAAAGHATLEVARLPLVVIIPTGDEIRPAGAPLGPGDVADSNSVMLAARAVQAGARSLTTGVQPDDADEIAAEVRRVAPTADLVLILSGSSAGRDDHTAAVLEQVGGVTARGVAVHPGHPVLLGHAKAEAAEAVPVIGVPGYPLAAAVIFELFALPVLTALQGTVTASRTRQRVLLGCDWTSATDVEEWVPVTLSPSARPDSPAFTATPVTGHGAGAVSRISQADAWWRIPIGQGQFTSGDLVEIRRMDGTAE